MLNWTLLPKPQRTLRHTAIERRQRGRKNSNTVERLKDYDAGVNVCATLQTLWHHQNILGIEANKKRW